MSLTGPSVIRVVAAISGAAWVWSWRTMYLEIHRWKHVTPSFRFNPGPPIPGTNVQPKPGLPLKGLFICSATAPMFFVGTVIAGMTRIHRAKGPGKGNVGSDFDRT